MSRQPRTSGYFRTDYAQDFSLLGTRRERLILAVFVLAVLAFPLIASPFQLDLACQVFLASIGALSLMLLTGFAGQISLGHAGLMAAGAFTVGILFRETNAPFWITLPAAAVVGALLGVIFGLPSLRLRGLYLAVSTLALHFIVIYLFLRYQLTQFGPAGISFETATLFGFDITTDKRWYFVLLVVAAVFIVITRNLLKMREGRAFIAIRDHEVAAAATGVNPSIVKLKAFAVSSFMVSVAGVLYGYNLGTATSESYTLAFTIDFYAMVIIGGMGSLLGAVLGAIVWQLLPQVLHTRDLKEESSTISTALRQ